MNYQKAAARGNYFGSALLPRQLSRTLAIAPRNGGLPVEKLRPSIEGRGDRARATRNGNDSMNSANTALSRPTGGGSRVLERDKLTLLAAPPP